MGDVDAKALARAARERLIAPAIMAGAVNPLADWWPELAPLTKNERFWVRSQIKKMVAEENKRANAAALTVEPT